MTAGQPLRGLVGQSMSGRRKSPTSYSYNYPAGSFTWTCPASGTWRLVLWAAGGGSTNGSNLGGGSGALYIAERFFAKGQTVALVVGGCIGAASNGANSTATLPDGEVITAGGGQANGTAGAVTANRNLDVVFAGSAGGAAGGSGVAGLGDAGGSGGAGVAAQSGGGGAPGYGPHRGGDGREGSNGNVRSAPSPAGGGGVNSSVGAAGGDGVGLIYRIKLRT
jgi:hypothetical protein